MRPLIRRELQGYFHTATAYLYLGVFLAVSSFLFGVNQLRAFSSDLTAFYSTTSYIIMLLTPVLVARLIAGERRQGTDELLFTSPLSLPLIVGAKFLAACLVFLFALVLSLAYPALVSVYGRIWLKEMLVVYLGLMLQGCAFIAFDLMVTASASSHTTASFLALGANLLLWLSSLLRGAVHSGSLREVFLFLSPFDRFTPFLYGQLSPANVLYYLGFTYLSLLATRLILARMKGGGAG